jgi:hypothetical protein
MNIYRSLSSRGLTRIAIMLVISIITFTKNVYSQELVECKKIFNSIDCQYGYKYCGHDSNNVYWYTTFNNQKVLHLRIADIKTLSLSVEKKLKLPSNYQNAELVKVKMHDGKLFILSSYFEKKEKMYYFFTETFDIETEISNGDLKKIAEAPGTNNSVSLQIVESQDKTHYAVLMYSFNDFEYSVSQLLVFKDDITLLYQSDLLEKLPGIIKINEIIVDNKGMVYTMLMSFSNITDAKDYEEIIVKYPKENISAYIQKPKYQYQILLTDEKYPPD